MFEDSTFESAGRIHTRSRGWSLAALALNSAILAALVAIPLMFPEALPRHMITSLLSAPPPPPAAPRPVPQQPAQAFHGAREMIGINLTVLPRIPTGIKPLNGPERSPGDQLLSMKGDDGVPGGVPFRQAEPAAPRVVKATPDRPTHISQGVAEGMLIQKIVPRYPPIAVASRTQGTVVLQAVISKSGTIDKLRVISGSAMLQQAALEAVSQWRYRPYLLNGQPVEVETTVNVVFSMGQ
jgi:periplasmic protein TonB